MLTYTLLTYWKQGITFQMSHKTMQRKTAVSRVLENGILFGVLELKPLYSDTIYSGHFSIVDAFFGNRMNYSKALISRPLYSGHLYTADTLFSPE